MEMMLRAGGADPRQTGSGGPSRRTRQGSVLERPGRGGRREVPVSVPAGRGGRREVPVSVPAGRGGRRQGPVLEQPGRAARAADPGLVLAGSSASPAGPATPERVRPRSSRPLRRLAGGAAPHARAAGRRHASRTQFVLLVVGLLAGGLVCLLVINTTLAAGSYQIGRLQQANATTSQRVQQLQQEVTTEQAPASIEHRAYQLGMRAQPVLNFVDLRNGRLYSTAASLPPQYAVPGYTP
jgi:hypothetical protein